MRFLCYVPEKEKEEVSGYIMVGADFLKRPRQPPISQVSIIYQRSLAHKDRDRDYSLLQNLAFSRLWVTEVHHFVKQLVDDDEVIPNAFFLELLKIFREDLDDLMKKEKNLGRIGVTLCEGEKIEIIVANVKILEFRTIFLWRN